MQVEDEGSEDILKSLINEVLERLEIIERELRRVLELEGRIMDLDIEVRRINRTLQNINNILTGLPEARPITSTSRDVKLSGKTVESFKEIKLKSIAGAKPQIQNLIEKRIMRLTETEREILNLLIEKPNIGGATKIAKTVNKAREHVCRILKKLSQENLLIRDESSWPYLYRVPERVTLLLREKEV